jgi:hypothetical protein
MGLATIREEKDPESGLEPTHVDDTKAAAVDHMTQEIHPVTLGSLTIRDNENIDWCR